MIFPTIHLNGTSKDHLLEAWEKAHAALTEAIKAMAEASPNARDYYPQGPGAFQQAIEQHMTHSTKLREAQKYLQQLCDEIAFK